MTAADHPPEITVVMEATQTINLVTGTAALTNIRNTAETRTGATDIKTTQTADAGRMDITDTETNINEDLWPLLNCTGHPNASHWPWLCVLHSWYVR